VMIEKLTTINALTMLGGFATVILNIMIRYRRGHKPCISRGKCTSDLLNGTTLVPFFVIAVSVFSDTLLMDLIKNGTAFLSTAGAIGGFFVLGEILKGESPAVNLANAANTPSSAAISDASKPHLQP